MRKDSNMMDLIVFWVALVMWIALIVMIAGGVIK